MLSSLYCSSAVLPLFVGMTVDKEQLDKRALLVGLLTCTVVGQALFALSLHMDWYGLSIGAQCVFGLAASSLVVVQRTIIAAKFKGQHAFALGCAMSASNLAKICGKAAAAPLAVSGYIVGGNIYRLIACALSVLVRCLTCRFY